MAKRETRWADLPKAPKRRRRFSEREVIETLMYSGSVLYCYRCGEPFKFNEKVEREHITEIGLGGKDEPRNCAYSHKACHGKITNGTEATTAGSSKQRIAKVKRLIRKAAGTWQKSTKAWPKRKMQSRPFEKRRAP